jgi:hypothetical protein
MLPANRGPLRLLMKGKKQMTEDYQKIVIWPNVDTEWPPRFTSHWYRLRAIESMTKQQMESMLAYLSGYTESGWDAAYEQSGANPIVPAEDDPDYNETYLQEWHDAKESESDNNAS